VRAAFVLQVRKQLTVQMVAVLVLVQTSTEA
jgi:hypothetical protein